MADLAVHAYRKKRIDMKDGFDIGAGPSRGVESAIAALEDLAGDGELDEDAVHRVAWMQDWENIVLPGGKPRSSWVVDDAGDTTTAVCDPKELAAIIATMATLRTNVPKKYQPAWDQLATFLKGCAKGGGTVCLYYDPMG
jgi:hypothetical protein